MCSGAVGVLDFAVVVLGGASGVVLGWLAVDAWCWCWSALVGGGHE